ncbi:MAG: VPLPA-CTERM sorting domain-containing protein [Pseudomonadales bacterium]
MKKILITLLGMLALPVSATYYSSSDTYSPKSGNDTGPGSYQKGGQSGGGVESFQEWLSANEKYAGTDFSKMRNRYHSWQGASPPIDDPQGAWEAYERSSLREATKSRNKQSSRNDYGKPGSKYGKGTGSGKGSSAGSFGSRVDWGGSKGSKGRSHSGGSKGGSLGSRKDWSGSKGSKGHSHGSDGKGGSRPDKWLDKEEKREKQLEAFKKILMHKLDKFPDWSGDKDSDWSRDFDKDFWSDKELSRALLCWLAPHLHEDEKWVNSDWKKLKHKIWWWLKHHKHKFPDDKPDPPAQVPLPASVYLFGTALLGLGAIGRKRRKTA